MNRYASFFLNSPWAPRHLLFSILAITCAQVHALEIRGEPASEADIATLPPVCKLILIEQPGVHHVVGQREHPELFERPEYRMAKGNPHLHHYCWSLIHKQRYFRAQGATQKNYRFTQFMGDIGYVLTNADKDWPYFHVMLLEEADLLIVRRDFPQAILKIQEALSHEPKYEKAYVLLYDAYLGMGDKKKAIKAAQDGLIDNPRSKPLRRRLKEQGILPPPPPPEPAAETTLDTAADTTTPSQSLPDVAKKQGNNSNQTQESTEIDGALKPVETPVIGTPDNPYCRFCP